LNQLLSRIVFRRQRLETVKQLAPKAVKLEEDVLHDLEKQYLRRQYQLNQCLNIATLFPTYYQELK